MNNGKIFVSKGSNKAYKGRNSGIDLSQPLQYFDEKEHTKIGENELFTIYKPKKQTA